MGYYKNLSIPADGPDVRHFDACPHGSHPGASCLCPQIDAEIREHLADLEIDRLQEEGAQQP